MRTRHHDAHQVRNPTNPKETPMSEHHDHPAQPAQPGNGGFEEGHRTLPNDNRVGQFSDGNEALPDDNRLGQFSDGGETRPPTKHGGAIQRQRRDRPLVDAGGERPNIIEPHCDPTCEPRPQEIGPNRATRQADFRAYAERRDPRARERLVRAHLPLANAIARRFDRGHRVPLEDLQQLAALGLIKALGRFDPSHGAAFSSFAVPTIQGEIRRYFRDFTWTVRPPRQLQEGAIRVERERDQLTTDLGRNPTAGELAQRLGCTIEDILEATQAGQARGSDSFDQPLTPDDSDDAHTLGRATGSRRPGLRRRRNHRRARSPARRHCPNATRWRSIFASARISPKPKSASASAARKCRSRASCAPPSRNLPSTHTPPSPPRPRPQRELILD